MNSNTDSTFFPSTRLTLLDRLSNPAAESWDEFFGVYGPLIYRMARYARLGEEAAEEVVAVVMRNFVGTVKKGFQFDPQQGRFRQYLRKITNRTIRLHQFQATGTVRACEYPFEILASVEELPDEAWAKAEREERWQACLERMRSSSVVSPRDFEAFEALVIHGEPAAKVAKRFGVTTNRLYGIKHSVIRRLRQIREDLDAELGEV
ncbi:MAG: sigma-70 family RNA polymerase sigma factor [Candidatus Hydrogenedentes bacterium]|nr:sigma-70 family RNA polymerase sigma factor [Candidatus Hydrogenedentota bacterium]